MMVMVYGGGGCGDEDDNLDCLGIACPTVEPVLLLRKYHYCFIELELDYTAVYLQHCELFLFKIPSCEDFYVLQSIIDEEGNEP